MKKITLLIFVLTGLFGFSQEFPLDFSDPLDVFVGASGSTSSIVVDPAGCAGDGCTGEVLEINGAGCDFCDPVELDLITYVDLSDSANNTITLDFYASRAGNLLVQFGNAAQDDPGENGYNIEIVAPVTPGLNSLVLDYDTASNGFPNGGDPVTLDKYGKIALFVDFGEGGIVATHWVDNIAGGLDGGPVAGDPVPATAAPTPPARDAGDVISIFSNAYTNITVDTFSAGFDDSDVEDVQIDGNDTKKYTMNNFLGIEFLNDPIDASAMTNFHIDFWAADTPTPGKVFNLKHSNWDGGAGEENPLELSINEGTTPALQVDTWVSIDVPLSDFSNGANGVDRDNIRQFLVTAANTLDVVYIDNIYFYRDPLSTNEFSISDLNVYPNPSNEGWTIKSSKSAIDTIQIYDILGKQVISLEPNSSEIRIDASTLNTGVYFAKIQSELGSVNIKLVKN